MAEAIESALIFKAAAWQSGPVLAVVHYTLGREVRISGGAGEGTYTVSAVGHSQGNMVELTLVPQIVKDNDGTSSRTTARPALRKLQGPLEDEAAACQDLEEGDGRNNEEEDACTALRIL